ncbi:MAG: hypothetical protein KDK04_11230 [Candidatus Competibacteraceae bacterium]|nr:hypothetical protein [Candidatus Competibacteraceae bacterium]
MPEDCFKLASMPLLRAPLKPEITECCSSGKTKTGLSEHRPFDAKLATVMPINTPIHRLCTIIRGAKACTGKTDTGAACFLKAPAPYFLPLQPKAYEVKQSSMR